MSERKLNRTIIKEEFVALTGDHVAAALLAQLEYWQARVNDFDRFIKEERRRSDAEGVEVNILESRGWIYKRAEELAEESQLKVSANTVRRRLITMVEKGWILERRNPHLKYDRVLQYRLDLHKIRDDLKAL